jgi:hypothetical protein
MLQFIVHKTVLISKEEGIIIVTTIKKKMLVWRHPPHLVPFLVFVLFLLLVFLVVDFLLLPLVPILFFAFAFDLDLVAFLVVGTTSRLVVVIGPGGVEGSVDSGSV